MKGFLYAVVSKSTGTTIDLVDNREEARVVKRWWELWSQPEKVKIVQYAPVKVVR